MKYCTETCENTHICRHWKITCKLTSVWIHSGNWGPCKFLWMIHKCVCDIKLPNHVHVIVLFLIFQTMFSYECIFIRFATICAILQIVDSWLCILDLNDGLWWTFSFTGAYTFTASHPPPPPPHTHTHTNTLHCGVVEYPFTILRDEAGNIWKERKIT